MPEYENETIVLLNSPSGSVNLKYDSPDSTFKLNKSKLNSNDLKVNELTIKTLYLSNDPTQRTWIEKHQSSSYVPPVLPNEPIRSRAIAEVIAVGSEVKNYKVGDVISTLFQWSKYGIIEESSITGKIENDSKIPLYYYFSVFGMTTMTAWSGLTQAGHIKKGDVVVVSAASGSTGSMVVQISKLYGASKVIGITSTSEKAKFVVDSLGADVGLNYNDADFIKQLKNETDGGIDLYFDNVGGELLDSILNLMKIDSRVTVCGAISGYNDKTKAWVKNWFAIITKRLNVKGFIVGDYKDKFNEANEVIKKGLNNGTIKGEVSGHVFDVSGKFEDVPIVWHRLFEKNKPNGKLITLVSDYGSK